MATVSLNLYSWQPGPGSSNASPYIKVSNRLLLLVIYFPSLALLPHTSVIGQKQHTMPRGLVWDGVDYGSLEPTLEILSER